MYINNLKDFKMIAKDYPKIEFSFNLDVEKEIFLTFWRVGQCLHPELNYILEEKNEMTAKKEISNFIDNYYQKKGETLKNNFEHVIKEWSEVEASYYQKVDKLLGNYPWPKENYQAFASVLYCFPRSIDGQWFTFPVNTKFNAIQVIAHEMLHFIVYDYMEKKFGLQPSECFDQDNKFWQFTENLNALIEDEPIWSEFMKDNKANVKNECLDLYKEMKKDWHGNVDQLIRKIFSL